MMKGHRPRVWIGLPILALLLRSHALADPPVLYLPPQSSTPSVEPPPAGQRPSPLSTPAPAAAVSLAANTPAARPVASKPHRVRVTLLPLPSPGVSDDSMVTIQRELGEALRHNTRLDMKDLDVRLADFAQEMPFDQVELARTSYQNGRDLLYRLELDKAITQLSDAVDQLVGVLPYIKKQELADAMMALAVAQMQKGNSRGMRATLKRLLTWRISYQPDLEQFPAQISEPLETVRQSLSQQPQGRISITSDPIGAQVFVDGEYVGVTPVSSDSQVVGEHYVTFKKLGYKRGLRVAQVTANATAQVNAALLRSEKYFLVEQALGRLAKSMGQSPLEPVADNLRETLFLDHGVFLQLQPRAGTARPAGSDRSEVLLASAFVYDLRTRRLLKTQSTELKLTAGAPQEGTLQRFAEQIYADVDYEGGLRPQIEAPPPVTVAPKPLYKRWWFWTAIGVIVAGSASALAVGLTARTPSCPDGHSCTGAVQYY